MNSFKKGTVFCLVCFAIISFSGLLVNAEKNKQTANSQGKQSTQLESKKSKAKQNHEKANTVEDKKNINTTNKNTDATEKNKATNEDNTTNIKETKAPKNWSLEIDTSKDNKNESFGFIQEAKGQSDDGSVWFITGIGLITISIIAFSICVFILYSLKKSKKIRMNSRYKK